MRQSSVDILTSVSVILVGIFFLLLAGEIRTSGFHTAAEALVGPEMVPKIIAWLIIGLGSLELISAALRRRAKDGDPVLKKSDDEDAEFSELSPKVLVRIGLAVGIGFAYVWLMTATGYLIATALVLAALLVLYGTTSIVKIGIIAICGGGVYYFLFIWLMGIYSPAGWLINLG